MDLVMRFHTHSKQGEVSQLKGRELESPTIHGFKRRATGGVTVCSLEPKVGDRRWKVVRGGDPETITCRRCRVKLGLPVEKRVRKKAAKPVDTPPVPPTEHVEELEQLASGVEVAEAATTQELAVVKSSTPLTVSELEKLARGGES